MAKNNCCKICGRLDYDDDGDYLICRVCGEKRLKKRIPWKEYFLSLLFLFCGFGSLLMLFMLHTYPTTKGMFDALFAPFDRYSNAAGSYNILELFLDKFQKDGEIVFIKLFFGALSVVFFILTAVFAKKTRDASKRIIV